MGIAGNVEQVPLSKELRSGLHTIRLIQCEDVDFTVHGGTGYNKVVASVLVEKTNNSRERIGADKPREMEFLCTYDFGKIQSLEFYAALEAEGGKASMDPEDFQEWDGANAFAKKLEVKAPTDTNIKKLDAFSAAQKAIEALNLRCDVFVTVVKVPNKRNQVNYKFFAPGKGETGEVGKPPTGDNDLPPA